MVYKKSWPLAFLISFILILMILIFALSKQKDQVNFAYVQANDKMYQVEVVSSGRDLYKGLSNRESVCFDCGMLFSFSDLAQRNFVMRDMMFPLDIIFLNDNQVINIYKNLEPEGNSPKNIYSSLMPANYVLELNAGQADLINLQIGDKVKILKK